MTKEEAKEFLTDISYKLGNMSVEYLSEKDGERMREAIKALEQEPCEDAVSLDGVIDTIEWYRTNPQHFTEDNLIEDIKGLPPVTPRTGKWIFVQRGKYVDMCCNECKLVRIKDYAYNYTVDQTTADKENVAKLFAQSDMQYCPYCGGQMEGESEW
jgi:hypothetical protein